MKFPSPESQFVYTRTYARWIEAEKRREHWPETVARVVGFLRTERGANVPEHVFSDIERRMLAFEVMPSMRLVWAAGDAAIKDNTTIYNCSFIDINSVEAFPEMLYILMCGTGCGFSVAPEGVAKLPTVEPRQSIEGMAGTRFVIEDSRAGWADSVLVHLNALYRGRDLVFDYNLIRKEGSRLISMGGRASGPGPLQELHETLRELFDRARGRQFTTLEVHDLCCQIAGVVVVGGVRRSSLISLSNLSDESLRSAKSGSFPTWRYMANNSAAYDTKPTREEFQREWKELSESGSGERGIFNRGAAQKSAPERRLGGLIMGTNPCGEIMLRGDHEQGGGQFCNLSEVVARAEDTPDDILAKIETATWAGALQASFIHFPYLRQGWKLNSQEERLLGVSITGQMDAPKLFTPALLQHYKERAIHAASVASAVLGINMPAAITCVKPSGTVSQLTSSSSGMHARFAPYYIRRYRIASMDPLTRMLRAQGITLSPENGQGQADWQKAEILFQSGSPELAKAVCPIYKAGSLWYPEAVNTWVVCFPVKSPKGAITVADMTAIDQLKWYKKLQDNYCEHNASCTIYVNDDEWEEVGDWVYDNFDSLIGVSFLPRENHNYQQPPYEEISKTTYENLLTLMPVIDYSRLPQFEEDYEGNGSRELACVGGACELGS